MVNIIPMAGEGTRFIKEGYKIPKPLVSVSGIPMIIKAVRDMPKSDKWVFIVRKEHIDDHKIDSIIRSEIPDAIIIPVKKTTQGQACTCMLAEPYLDPDEPIFIAACDNGYLYDKNKYAKLCNDGNVDCVVWTFTRRETLKLNPSIWGWCELGNDGITIRNMSTKVPVSNNPYSDHAVVASFFFKKAKEFIDAYKLMVKENYRINNEFYIDAIPTFLKKLGKRSVIFDVRYYAGWGTPQDLKNYQKVESFCKHGIRTTEISEEDEKLLPLWKEYFNIEKSLKS